jgi:hypothetical protein
MTPASGGDRLATALVQALLASVRIEILRQRVRSGIDAQI